MGSADRPVSPAWGHSGPVGYLSPGRYVKWVNSVTTPTTPDFSTNGFVARRVDRRSHTARTIPVPRGTGVRRRPVVMNSYLRTSRVEGGRRNGIDEDG